MLKLSEIRRVHVELTTRCNARCPMCMRNYRGYDYNSGYPLCELSVDEFKHILTPSVLAAIMQSEPPINGLVPARFGLQGVSFNGNLGDFASAKDGVEIVQYLVEHHVPVMINSNGSVRSPAWWARMAMPGVTVGFALDGLADTHHLYRQDTDWHRIIDHAGKFSHQIGYDSRPKHIVPELAPMLENHITWYDSKTIKHPKDTPELNIQCIHIKNKEIYIAADGSVYPCCFLGFYPGQMQHPGNQELAPLVKENNALKYPLEHCLEWFDQVEQTWKLNSIAEGRTYQCVTTCNKSTL